MTNYLGEPECGRLTRGGKPCRSMGPLVWLPPGFGQLTLRAPACRSHLRGEELAEWERIKATVELVNEEHWSAREPACWSWLPPEPWDLLGDDGLSVIAEWQQGRCAVCGHGGPAVCDHDHQTGYVRGYLCRSCNTREAFAGRDGAYLKYRERNPASILGIQVMYVDPFGRDPISDRPASIEDLAATTQLLADYIDEARVKKGDED